MEFAASTLGFPPVTRLGPASREPLSYRRPAALMAGPLTKKNVRETRLSSTGTGAGREINRGVAARPRTPQAAWFIHVTRERRHHEKDTSDRIDVGRTGCACWGDRSRPAILSAPALPGRACRPIFQLDRLLHRC